jgi:predicted ATPase/class 3 adenylate cyclase
MRPTGTVTFLFTDIEASTRHLAEVGPDRYGSVLEQHRAILRDAWSRHEGHDFGSAGDSMFVAFHSAQHALRAAVEAQCALTDHAWSDARPVRVRMGLHTCEAILQGDDYVGIGVHRASRICDAAHGGQILVSHATQALIADDAEFGLRDLGSHTLKSLPEAQRLFQLLHPHLPAEFPPPRTAGQAPPNLPPQMTTFIGREDDVAAISSALRHPGVRVLTLTGPGGTGKTRLAVHVATAMADDFPQGVHFVSLASTADPALVLPAIAQTLGVSAAAGQSLSAYLAGKSTLIVLDNLEQVIAAAPDLAALTAQAPLVKFLVTSREPLRIAGERLYPVSPLPLPDLQRDRRLQQLAQCPSVQLFAERAQTALPSFALTEENVSAVAEICRKLDGLPLAIELAAARIRLLSPAAMLQRLPQRLDLLTAGGRDAPARQQTIRNALAWSFDLLAEDERNLFASLGVFVGEFTIEAAEAVCAASLDAIGSLVDKSLVQLRHDRLDMLETIRSFAVERLNADLTTADAVRNRHAAYYEALVDDACAQRAVDEKQSLDRLELAHDNIRVALDCLRERSPLRFAHMAGLLGGFFHLHSHFVEGRGYLVDASTLATTRDRERARVLSSLGELAAWSGDLAMARTSIDEAVSIWREVDEPREIAAAMLELGWGCFISGEDLEARECMEEALRMARTVGERALIDRARIGLLQVLVALGELDIVEPMAREALGDAERQGDLRSAHFAHHFLADCALIRGDAATAAPRYRRALELAIELGDRAETATEIQGIAMATAGMSMSQRALTLGGAATAEFDRLGIDLSGIKFWSVLLRRYFDQARYALSAADGDAAWEAGRQLSFETAVNDALSA